MRIARSAAVASCTAKERVTVEILGLAMKELKGDISGCSRFDRGDIGII